MRLEVASQCNYIKSGPGKVSEDNVPYHIKVTMLLDTLFVVVVVFLPSAHGEAAGLDWCYHNATCNQNVWASFPHSVCNGTRQSPININTSVVQGNASLTSFVFTGFASTNTMKTITNSDHTVKVNLGTRLVNVTGGGLSGTYNALQFHLHWGNGSNEPGSEHTVDGKRFPMELHLVTVKAEYNSNTSLAFEDPEGVAALSFLIDGKNDSDLPASWKILTSYLFNITTNGQKVNITQNISLDDLLVGVDREKYYRYKGSLTTPTCNEAVVWTVFKDPIKISKNLINLFSSTVEEDHNLPLINVFRSSQAINGRVVTTPVKASASSPIKAELTLLLLSLSLLHAVLEKWDM